MSVSISTSERLVGRDSQPRVGMTVKLTEQALERRAENGRSDPSKGGTGVIVKCHPNWTCDVMWHNTKRVRVGYACGTAAVIVDLHKVSCVLRVDTHGQPYSVEVHKTRWSLSVSEEQRARNFSADFMICICPSFFRSFFL
mmetsp:Transcript_93135/g.150376  ORF Transcript_93135/g.150376 Transcript_93135/m.150376 type:complete len:141 (+) Transcript_93135:79-501(+)